MHPVPQSIGTAYGVPGDWAAGYHPGADYLSPNGTQAQAVLPGKVIYAGWNGWGRAYGRTVILEHVVNGVPFRVIYAHLAEWLVDTGDTVKAGQPVAKTNNTGNTSGPHLHLEVRHYPFAYGDDVNPNVLTAAAQAPIPGPAPGAVTVFDVCNWNVASPRWFTPWAPRASGIKDEIRGEASIYGFQEVYSEDQAATIQNGLGANFTRVPGRAGLELFYDSTKWQLERPARSYPSGVQGRYALVVHLTRKATGQHVAFVVFHAPAATTDSVKTAFGQWLSKLLGQIDGPILLMGDANRSVQDKSPRKEIRAAGFRDMRDQAAIVNESAKEFPSRSWNLCDIWTDLNDAHNDTIVGGIIDLTAARLSDHRRIEATVKVVVPKDEPAPEPAHLEFSKFKRTLPTGEPGHPDEVYPLTDQTEPEEFRAPVNGVTTSGTKYARDELREEHPDEWSSRDGKHHQLDVVCRVTEIPGRKIDDYTPGVVFGQIHDDSDDVVILLADVLGRIILEEGLGKGNGSIKTVLHTGYRLGDEISYLIDAHEGGIDVTVNGRHEYIDKTVDGAYYKAGAYLRGNTSNATGEGAVVIYKLGTRHA